MSRLKHFISEYIPLWMRMGGRRLFYYGNKHFCDMCGSKVRTFLQNGWDIPILSERRVIGGMPRAGDRCPVCHSQDRTRLMRLYLERETQIGEASQSVLHVAPDLGLVLWFKRLENVAYTSCDLSPRRYRHVPNFIVADLTDLPFKDKTFDLVICSHVLEHVPNDKAAMSELHRVTKLGGVVLALTPLATDEQPTDEAPDMTDPAERERRFGQWDHVRLYHRADFIRRLEAAGFDVSLWDPYTHDGTQAEKWHLNPLELLPVCQRAAADESGAQSAA